MCGMRILAAILCLEISTVSPAPLLLQPLRGAAVEPSQQTLQQQLLELQMMPRINSIPQLALNGIPYFVILLPNQPLNTNVNVNPNERIQSQFNNDDIITKDAEELNSVTINAEPVPILEEQKAFLLVPSGRFILGDLISAIPFLPFEINVPDTISWAYNGISNGISGIISIIGSGLPFQRLTEVISMKNANLNPLVNELQMKTESHAKQLVIVPLGGAGRPMSLSPLWKL